MEKKYLVGKVNCETEMEKIFQTGYYVVEENNLFAIQIVKEPFKCVGNGEREIVTSFPISRTREVVERLARIFMKNMVTPTGLFECLDDLYDIC